MREIRKHGFYAVILMTVGSLQMLGDVCQIPLLKGFGSALHASPAPKVFTTQNGFETFSSRFFIEWQDSTGSHSTEITHEHYHNFKGHYNRRNVYGALFSYAPLLASNPRTKDMFYSVFNEIAFGKYQVLQEIGLPITKDSHTITLAVRPRLENVHNYPLNFKAINNTEKKGMNETVNAANTAVKGENDE